MKNRFSKLAVPLLTLVTAACSGGGSGGGGNDEEPELPQNQAPMASFTLSSESGLSPATIAFDASGSSDADGSISNYQWDFGDGTAGSGQKVEHTFNSDADADKEFLIRLTITDDDGATASSESIFTVLENTNPVAKFSFSQPDLESRLIVIDASESQDRESAELLYQWNFGDGDTGEGVQTEHEYQENGEYLIRLIVDDQTGRTSEQEATAVVNNGKFAILGQLSAAPGQFADGDTNDLNTDYAPNNSLEQAQEISGIGNVSGFVDFPDENSTAIHRDQLDIYVTSLKAGQEVRLHMQDWNDGEADLDLYLINEAGSIIDSSAGLTEMESLSIQEDGKYYLLAATFQGASAYRLSLASATAGAGNALRASDNFIAGELVARLRPSMKRAGMRALTSTGSLKRPFRADQPLLLNAKNAARAFGGSKTTGATSYLGVPGLKISAEMQRKMETIDALKHLHASGQFEYVELNHIYQHQSVNDPLYPQLWHYQQIDLSDAWRSSTGEGTIVAVLDTGILSEHPDIQGQLVPGYDMISDPNNAVDGDGIDPDPEDPGDEPNNTNDSWHGTHVAGTVAAAANNGTGIAGVAYGAKIMPVRVLGADGGSNYDIAQAIYFASGLANDSGTVPERRADVINMSLGGPGRSQTMQDAVTAAREGGVIVVVAAGNDNDDARNYTPANLDGVVTVAAVRRGGVRAGYSNFGPSVELTAPGGDTSSPWADGGVISTLGRETAEGDIEFVYGGYQGTSMAAPHVAGVVALMKQMAPEMTPEQFDQLIMDFGVSYGEAPSATLGYGQIDAERAVASAQALAGIAPTGRLYIEGGRQRELWTQTSVEVELLADTPEVTLAEISTSEPWLSATYLGNEASRLGSYRLTVDADSLTTGRYSSILSITASTETRFDLLVSIQIIDEEVDSGGNLGALYVEFTDIETDESVERVMATFDQEQGTYRYMSPELDAAREYTVMAGPDVDNDSAICEVDDLCGVFADDEGSVPVAAGDLNKHVRDIDMKIRIVPNLPEEAVDSALQPVGS